MRAFRDPGSIETAREGYFERTMRRLGHDVVRYVPGFVVPAVLSAVHVVVFTRVFDPTEFGRFSLVFVTSHVLTLLLSAGMIQSVLRYQARFESEGLADGFVASLARLLGGYIATFAVALVVVFLVSSGRLGAYRWHALSAIVMVASGVAYSSLKAVFQARLESGRVARYHILFAAWRVGLALALVGLVARNSALLIVAPAAAYTMLAVVMARRLGLWRKARAVARADRPRLLGMFASYGVPLMGWLVGAKTLEIADRYVIEFVRGTGEVGIYSANYNLVSMAMWLVASPVLAAAYPLATGAWEGGRRDDIQELVARFSRYYLLAAAGLASLLAVMAPDVVALLLGPSFREGYTVVPLVAAGLVLWNYGIYGDKGIRLAERTRLVLAIVVACAAVNVALNLALVPAMGYRGAAVATLASSALYPTLVWIASRRVVPWQIPWRSVWRILACALGAAAVCAALRRALGAEPALVRLAVAGLGGALAYAAALWVTREVQPFERDAVLGRLRRRGKPSSGEAVLPRVQEIEYSGDIGVEVWAPSREMLFEALAQGLFGLMASRRARPRVRRTIEVTSPTAADLVVDFLAELVFAAASNGEVYSDVRVSRVDDTSLEATVAGEPADPQRHALRFDVKAATYHGLVFESGADGCHARVIFDL